MAGRSLLGSAVKLAYRKWGLKGVAGMAVVGAVLYLVWHRRLERFVGEAGTGP